MTSPRTKKGRRRRCVTLSACLLILPLSAWSYFPAPVRELWPPRPGEARREIDVVLRDWHTVIVEPLDGGGYREWELCEKGWYLEGRQGFTGVCRALFWPSDAGLGRRDVAEPAWTRYPGQPLKRWRFIVGERGLEAMHASLEAERGDSLAEFPGWFAGKRSYHLLHECHHYTMAALRESGLPIRPWWAYAGWMVTLQLDRARSIQDAEGLSLPAEK